MKALIIALIGLVVLSGCSDSSDGGGSEEKDPEFAALYKNPPDEEYAAWQEEYRLELRSFLGKWESSLSNCIWNADSIEFCNYKKEPFLIIADSNEVHRFIQNVEVDEYWSGSGVCDCGGFPTMVFKQATNELAVVSVHHGFGLRWHGGVWPGNQAFLTSNSMDRVGQWLESSGVEVQR